MRRRRLSRKESIIRFLLRGLLGCGILIGFIMVVGGVGSVDYSIDVGTAMTDAERVRSYAFCIAGPLLSLICYYTGYEFNLWDD